MIFHSLGYQKGKVGYIQDNLPLILQSIITSFLLSCLSLPKIERTEIKSAHNLLPRPTMHMLQNTEYH